jgi:hypothetical protein
MKRLFILFFVLLVATCFMQAAPSTVLTLSDGVNSVSVDETGAVIPVGMAAGIGFGTGPHQAVVFAGLVGGFTFNVTTGRGSAAVIAPTLMNVSSINVLSTGSSTLTIQFTDTGYTTLRPVLNLSASATITAGTPDGSSATFSGYADAANGISPTLDATTLIGTIGPFTKTTGSAAQSFAANVSFANPIGSNGSLTERIVLFFSGPGEIDTGFTIANVVPEPASVVMFGTMLLGITSLLRNKFKRS